MSARDFLSSVLPDEGYLIVATPHPIPNSTGTWWENVAVPTLDEALEQCTAWLYDGRDVYYALASYEKERVWNPNKIVKRTGAKGAWERRTQSNVKAIRTLFLDLDVKPGKADHYQTQAEALVALRSFRLDIGLPKPALVSSGFGVHAYWKFTTPVSRDTWQPIAEKLKSCAIQCALLADHNVTADAARVLRPPGGFNFKHPPARPVELRADPGSYELADLDAALSQYVTGNNVPVAPTRTRKAAPAPKVAVDGIEDNLGTTNNPLVPDVLVYECPAFARQVANRGAGASEPQWYHAVGIAKFCEPQRAALLAVSDAHAGFSEAGLADKVLNWTQGPPVCDKIHAVDKVSCPTCIHWQKVKSPATVGRMVDEPEPIIMEAVSAEEPAVELPPPPSPYARTSIGGEIKITRIVEGKHQIICPYDFFPTNVMERRNADDEIEETSMWTVILPREDKTPLTRSFRLPLELLADPRKLHAKLLKSGLRGLNVNHAKVLPSYMSAYTEQLARKVDNNQMYERMGWHDDHKIFVLPKTIFSRAGGLTRHLSNSHLNLVTRNAIHSAGTLEAWMNSQRFYGGPSAAFRTFHLAAFASPMFHVTGHKGILLSAAGDTGRGKTTMLESCGSIWGNPETMLVGGGKNGTTINAMYSMLGSTHSLPFLWDDTTERDPDEMRDFMLQISQGRGKERLHGNEHDGKVVTWETMVLSSTNADDVHRLMASGKDSTPHLMRMMSVEFDMIDRSSEVKIRADQFKRTIRQNYGHAGPIVLAYYIKHYDQIAERIIRVMEKLDREVSFQSEERYLSAAIASMLVCGRIAYRLGVYPFDSFSDLNWYKDHVSKTRVTQKLAVATPAAILDGYLNTFTNNTLIVQPKGSSNLDNVSNEPRGGLFIRNEIDTGLLYVARDHFRKYCSDVKAHYGKIEADLVLRGVITRADCNKVLGGGTKWAIGQTRCWEISLAELVRATDRNAA